MFDRQTLAAVLAAAMLLLAGCAGGVGTGATDGSTDDQTAGDATVNFYISDRPGAIEDFEHLNVTVTKVGLQKAGEGDDEDDENETESVTEPSETTTTEKDTDTTVSETPTTVGTAEDDEGDGWETYEVEEKTFDLTELQGANASQLGNLSVESGEYSKVFIYVSEVDGTLENGEQVTVKLPSSKLQLNKQFTVGPNSTTDFVFDVTVFKAGNSGKYILKPVVSESGTGDEVEIDDVDEDETGEDERAENARDEDDESEGDSLSAQFTSDVRAGSDATLRVTQDGAPVANATVDVADGPELTTDENGEVTIAVPEDAEELELEVKLGDAETELSVDVRGGGNGNGNGNDYRLAALV